MFKVERKNETKYDSNDLHLFCLNLFYEFDMYPQAA